MANFPSFAVQSTRESVDQLRITLPPNSGDVFGWVAFSLVFFLLLRVLAPGKEKVNLALASLCLIPALIFLSATDSIVLSRTDGTVNVDMNFVFYHDRQSYPLANVRRAEIKSNETGGRMLYLENGSSGISDPSVGWQKWKGFDQAATDINNFLIAGRK